MKVKNGDVVTPGTALTEGPLNPRDVLRTCGVKAVQEYLLNEVLSVYKSQSVDINAKHLEIIIKQMLRKVKIENAGDTNLLPGDIVDIRVYEEANLKALQEGGVPATAKRELQGITKASLTTESFLSAASFQESSNVLTEAALKGKVDRLQGLKENIIIGKMIPAGTGAPMYRNILPKQIKDELNKRCFFVVTEINEKIATATISKLIEKEDGYDAAVDWFAITKEHQGKKLAKPMISYFIKIANFMPFLMIFL